MNDVRPKTLFEVAHASVCELIDRFEKYARDTYLLPGYQEAEARKDFIDPLLKALGWDVDHEREHNPYEQEVKVDSSLVNFFYDTQYGGDKLQGGYLRIGPPQLKMIPICLVDATNVDDVARHDRIVSLVKQMLAAKQQEATASGHALEIAARKCAALDRQIDALVYELYGLTEEEIALVEGHA